MYGIASIKAQFKPLCGCVCEVRADSIKQHIRLLWMTRLPWRKILWNCWLAIKILVNVSKNQEIWQYLPESMFTLCLQLWLKLIIRECVVWVTDLSKWIEITRLLAKRSTAIFQRDTSFIGCLSWAVAIIFESRKWIDC